LLALDGVFKKPFSSKGGGIGEEEYNTYQTIHPPQTQYFFLVISAQNVEGCPRTEI